MISAVGEWLSQLPEKMAYYAGYAIGQFITFFVTLPERIQEIWSQVISSATTFATQFAQKATEMAKNFFNSLMNGLQSLPSRLASLGQQLVGALKSLPDKFLEIGSNIVKGLWNGISSGWSWLTDKVKGLADSLLQGVKDGLKISSPSKAFADEVGRWIPAGIAVGITGNMSPLNKAMQQMTDDMLNMGISDLTSAGSSYGSYESQNGATGGYYQTVNIYSPTALTPSEVARQTRNATRSMVLALKGV